MSKRHADFSGELNPAAILTEDNVIEIWTEYYSHPEVTCECLARKYGVNPSTIRAIVKRRTWKSITAHLKTNLDCTVCK